MSSFEGEKTQTQYNVLSFRIELCFHNYKLAIKIDENRCSDLHIDYGKESQKAMEQELGYKLIRIDSEKEEFDILRGINKIYRHIKQSTKKTLINRETLTKSLNHNITKSKAIRSIFKKILPDYQ